MRLENETRRFVLGIAALVVGVTVPALFPACSSRSQAPVTPALQGVYQPQGDPHDAPLADLSFDGAGHYSLRRRLCRFPCDEDGTYRYDAAGRLELTRSDGAESSFRLNVMESGGLTTQGVGMPVRAMDLVREPIAEAGPLLGADGGLIQGAGTRLVKRFLLCLVGPAAAGGDAGACLSYGEYALYEPDGGLLVTADAGHLGFEGVDHVRLLSNLKQPTAVVASYMMRSQDDFMGALACAVDKVGVSFSVVATDELADDAKRAAQKGGCGSGVDVIPAGGINDEFIQDFAEVLALTPKPDGGERLAVLNLAHPNFSAATVDAFAARFGAPVIEPPYTRVVRPDQNPNPHPNGDVGGNLEGLPSGAAYIGDKMGPILSGFLDGHATGKLTLPSNWLVVGHVDEYVGFVPAKNACGKSVVYGDPTSALSALASMPPSDYDQGSATLSQGCTEVLNPCGPADIEFSRYGQAALIDATRHFLTSPQKAPPFSFKDFDLTIPARPGAPADKYVLDNLTLYRDQIKPGLDKLGALSEVRGACSDGDLFTPVPMLFRYLVASEEGRDSGWIADTPGVANFIVLRDLVVLPDPYFAAFRDATSAALAPRGVSLQFIDTKAYHFLRGEVHCGTQVVRDLTRDFSF